MKSLTGYLSEAAGKNTHMTHIEDLVLDGGVKGAPSHLTVTSVELLALPDNISRKERNALIA